MKGKNEPIRLAGRCIPGMKTFFLVAVFALAVSFISCRKNQSIDLKPDLNVADNIVIAEEAYNHIVLMLIRSLSDPLLKIQGHIYLDSGYVAYDSVQNKVTFYYINKLSPDSIARYGLVEVQMTGNILVKGGYANAVFSNYHSDMQEITGSDSLINEGIDPYGKMVFVNIITGGEITRATDTSILWESANRFKVDPAVFTGNPGNYYVLISGNASGTSTGGYAFTAATSDSLIYWSGCPWITGDKMRISISDVEVPTGIIIYNIESSCSYFMKYDFEGNIYYTRMNYRYLKH